ncbi:YqaA family protein [Novosphingobium mangrovi (ex Huang et al. 2023)]|uniref:DedA family protein n=1 Tax=Novosphingobium mangrovi (ex Huang et al. 2023) TaxID=2976432 RepID=A0ABT2I334_9SPHN|nr:YqaA family protein [Novosphingobium mangrovi (ex Huang et al. 2023)]MCT2399212.1 DedA family protein [Novosphingobium mangrovi (ex Huang et al. 2023)]
MLRRLYDWTMEKAAHRHAEWWLAAFAFMEASFFPVPPHPLLGLMCLAEPKKAVRFAAVATFASVVGGMLGYAIGHFAYQAFGEALLRALGLAESFPTAACYLREYGAEIIVVKGATPIPFKLLTITAGFIHMNMLVFIGASVISRSISFMIVGVLFRLFGAPIKAVIDKHLGKVTAAFALLVVLGFLAIAFMGGGAEKTNEKCVPPASVALN